MAELKKCVICGVMKPLDSYRPDQKARDGKHSYCRECHNEKNRRWRASKKAAGVAPSHRRDGAPDPAVASVAPVHRRTIPPPAGKSTTGPAAAPPGPGRRRSQYVGWRKHGVLIRPEHLETLRAWSFHRRQDVAAIIDAALAEYFARHEQGSTPGGM